MAPCHDDTCLDLDCLQPHRKLEIQADRRDIPLSPEMLFDGVEEDLLEEECSIHTCCYCYIPMTDALERHKNQGVHIDVVATALLEDGSILVVQC